MVDDHRTFADLLALALSGQPDLECVGTASSAGEALALSSALQPDIVVMDVRLGQDDGLEVTRQLIETWPALRVVVLTAHANHALLQRAASVGACCLLPKDGSLVDMLGALRSARPGGFAVHPTLMSELFFARSGGKRELAPELTQRERDVLHLLNQGSDARAISRALGISLNTCRSHVRSLLSKLNAHSQLEAVANAKRVGLFDGAGTD